MFLGKFRAKTRPENGLKKPQSQKPKKATLRGYVIPQILPGHLVPSLCIEYSVRGTTCSGIQEEIMLAVLLKSASNIDPFLAILGPLCVLYLVYRKVKTWIDNHPDDWAALLDKAGLHKFARSIWDKLDAKHAEEEANTFLGVSLK